MYLQKYQQKITLLLVLICIEI